MFGRVTNMTRCLVIESRSDERNRTVDLLQDLGFDVRGSQSVDEAITFLDVEVPDVVLVEQLSEAKQTAAALLRIREAARRKGKAPLLLLCSEARDPQAIGAAIMHGASECLIKPFDGAVLENKLKQCGLV